MKKINIGNNKFYDREELIQYAKDNKEELLKMHMINDENKEELLLVANIEGWCTFFSEKSNNIIRGWAGGFSL